MKSLNQRILHAAAVQRAENRNRDIRQLIKVAFFATVVAFFTSLIIWRHGALISAAKKAPTSNVATDWKNDDGVPTLLFINGEQWKVYETKQPIYVANGLAFIGETYCSQKLIVYYDVTPRQKQRENLMHEIFHAGACSHGGDTWWNSSHPTFDEHPGIYHLGEFMSVFIHDNPEFMQWMAQ